MLEAMVAQRCDSIRRYEASGQLELADREAREIEVIKRFLPPKLDEQACAEAVREVIADVGAREAQGHGQGHDRAQEPLPRPDGFRQGAADDLSAAGLIAPRRRARGFGARSAQRQAGRDMASRGQLRRRHG